MGPGGNQGSRSSPRDAPSLERGSIALTAGAPISGCGHHRALHRTRRADRRGDRGRGWTPAEFIAADLNDIESVRRLAEQAGEIDVLVNNAAAHTFAPTLEHDVESFDMTFDVNVRGPFFLTAALLPKMIARGSGAIVNISTMGASSRRRRRPGRRRRGGTGVFHPVLGSGLRRQRDSFQHRRARAHPHRQCRRHARRQVGTAGLRDTVGPNRGPDRDRRGNRFPGVAAGELPYRRDCI